MPQATPKYQKSMIIEILEILFDGLCVGLASSVTVGPVAVLCIQRTLSKGHLSGMMSGLGVAVADTLMAILAFTVYALLKSSIDEYSTAIQICGGIFVVIVGIFIFFKNPVPQIRKNRAGKTLLWQDFISMFGFTMANFVVIIPYILAFFTMFNIELADTSTPIDEPQHIEAVSQSESSEQEEEVTPYESLELEQPMTQPVTQPATVTERIEESATSVEQKNNTSQINRTVRNILVVGGFFTGAVAWWFSLTALINLLRRGFRPRHMLTINHIAGIIISALGIYTLISVIIS